MVTAFGTLSLTFLNAIIVLLVSISNAADLKSDLREFTALIPRRRVGYIAARHFVLDSHFRRALIFIRKPAFKETWQQVRNTTEFEDIVTYVTASGTLYDVTSVIDSVPNRLRAFQIPAKVPVMMVLSRTFSSFLREVIDALPRAKIVSLMTRKVKEGGEFAHLYRVLKSDEFRELVHIARNSSNLAVPLRTLEKNSINVDDIMDMGYSVLNWGP